ncbi:PIR protein [Plasmodium yoelii]|uniref:PIR protein n=2 Tax=Plasmodium yoelii TaxID=5861 RepID=A0AAF0B2Z6_PLAYO|nr:PIR protein [Plasmodium yoelii]WBY60522.1 PIR protein [Plasmodium yoelii yoelii]VTZ81299.1 PIR protein [Plasmodium yoelii]|eukprot:XP_022811088.1 PIR protein [Plasmodium yoelii]
MDDSLCGQIEHIRKHLPDNLDATTKLDFYQIEDIKKYCPDENCNTDLDKNTAGFLWLLGKCYYESTEKNYDKNSINTFFIHMISWFSYKLKQISYDKNIPLNDFYNEHVRNNYKYNSFTTPAYTIADLGKFMDERTDLLNINIEDLSKFYDASKLICIMYGNVAKNEKYDILSNNANDFVQKYTELNKKYNDEDGPHSKILSALSTDYNNLKKKRKGFQSLPDIPGSSALASTYEVTSLSSSTGTRLFTVLSIFGAIAFFLGISYKYSLFGFRKRFQKQKLREKIKNIKKKMGH